MLIGFSFSNIWVKRTVSHPQELRQGKKISSTANTEMQEANTSMGLIADTDSTISYVWKPIIGNNLVEDVNYNKFDKIEVTFHLSSSSYFHSYFRNQKL